MAMYSRWITKEVSAAGKGRVASRSWRGCAETMGNSAAMLTRAISAISVA
jgi:hypothetical protein